MKENKSAVKFNALFIIYWISLIGSIFLNEISADETMAMIKAM